MRRERSKVHVVEKENPNWSPLSQKKLLFYKSESISHSKSASKFFEMVKLNFVS